ncbi:MAG: membrane protein insertion efficiency factor YidD [Oscillospiraceae bacterium]|jgi:putative membrane protein insertion efficiency factor|nr:membrane protein insertion efficiency factor YidD [Oscillospiraceae bacterium]
MRRLFISFIRFYQRHLSSMKAAPSCKYDPTCSQYALEAIERFGSIKGFGLAIWRVLRCNPFSHGGYDPVPEVKQKQ